MSEKGRGCLIVLVVLIVGAIGIYYGARWAYYQGWWGKYNPVARYLWLCNAPAEFEGTLYPEEMDILMPACENLGIGKEYHRTVLVTSDRLYAAIMNPSGHDWIDLRTNDITTTRPTTSALEDCVSLVDKSKGIVSEDERRVAKQDGIYNAQTGEKLLDYGLPEPTRRACKSIHTFYPCAWTPGNQSVLLIPSSTPWGLELLALDCYYEYLTHSNYPVPQPVLKFNVPEAYR